MLSQMNILSRLNYLFKTLPIIVQGTVFDETRRTNDLIIGKEVLSVSKKAVKSERTEHCLLLWENGYIN